jgi:uncharacterized membrane protein
MNKIVMIASSIRCRRYGMASLVPLLGAPFLALAFWNWHRARAASGDMWNPARRHLITGYVLAWVGALVLIATLGLVAMVCFQP